MVKKISSLIPVYILILLTLAGIFAFALKNFGVANNILKYTLIVFSIPLWITIVRDMLNKNFGVDLIAGVALVASFAFGEYLPGVVVLLMLSGGQALESYAMNRAKRDLSALLNRAPTIAHIKQGTVVTDILIEEVKLDDIVVVKPGETIPVDGVVISGEGRVDESTITGESLPVEKNIGSPVVSGTINKDGSLEVRALKIASESRLAQIINLVKQAEEEKAPLVRLADTYSVYFTIVTFGMALAAWFVFGETSRVLAVLVVATPCPLILATPIAIISGISKAAKRGIIVKNGGALEGLAQAKSFVFDKTGTITLGVPNVLETVVFNTDIKSEDVLRISSSLDQLSVHILARSLVEHAIKNKNITLSYPLQFKEYFGDGVMGIVDGVEYMFGKLGFIESQGVDIPDTVTDSHEKIRGSGNIGVYLAKKESAGTKGKILGAIYFADILRGDSMYVFEQLREQKIEKVMMLTGDHRDVAEKIAKMVGITEFKSDCLPEDKLSVIKELQKKFSPLVMVGDGVNDAPALTQADVGIALGGTSETASSDTADIVIVSPDLSRILEAFTIAKRSFSVAKQGIWIGIGLSIVCMILSLLGYIEPLAGALIQEVIDVIVILNALRVGIDKRI